MKSFKIITLAALFASANVFAGQMADNANIGWIEAQCVAVAHLDSDGYNGAKADKLAERAKVRLAQYYDQMKSKTIPFDESQGVGGNLSKVVASASNSQDFYYQAVAMYTEKVQQERARANYAADAIEHDYYYSLRWINGGCDAIFALENAH